MNADASANDTGVAGHAGSAQGAAKPLNGFAGLAQGGVIQRIGDADVGAEPERAALHNGDIRFIQQGMGDLFIAVQYSPCG